MLIVAIEEYCLISSKLNPRVSGSKPSNYKVITFPFVPRHEKGGKGGRLRLCNCAKFNYIMHNGGNASFPLRTFTWCHQQVTAQALRFFFFFFFAEFACSSPHQPLPLFLYSLQLVLSSRIDEPQFHLFRTSLTIFPFSRGFSKLSLLKGKIFSRFARKMEIFVINYRIYISAISLNSFRCDTRYPIA